MLTTSQYLADMSSKSANYCCSHNSGGEALLLLCGAELGQPMQALTDATYTAGEDAMKKGMFSTWGQGNTGPKGWKDASCVNPSLAGVTMVSTPMSSCTFVLLIHLLSRTRPSHLARQTSTLALTVGSTTASVHRQPFF